MADPDSLGMQHSSEETDGGTSQKGQSFANLKHRAPQLPRDEEELRRIIHVIPQHIVLLDCANQEDLCGDLTRG